jgi:hypothetical protein
VNALRAKHRALTAEAFFGELSAETRARALATRDATVRRFAVAADAVRIVPFDFRPDGTMPLVILASGNGLKMGSWDDIAGERRNGNLTIDVQGVAVDTCEAMTWPAYQALVREAKASGLPALPDSAEVAARAISPGRAPC